MEFEIKLKQWLDEVAINCNEFAKEIDLDFYPFQSPLPKERIELLIIAINPGGAKKYSEMLNEKSDFLGKKITSRTIDMLYYDVNTYAVKPQWEKGTGNDVMRKKLEKVFNNQELKDLLNDSTIINKYYFNTRSVSDLSSLSNKIKSFCLSKTKEFIDIVNPKCILFFTTSDFELSNCGVKQVKPIGNFVKTGILKDKEILAIPNPGFYRAYSYKNGNEMGIKILEYLNK